MTLRLDEGGPGQPVAAAAAIGAAYNRKQLKEIPTGNQHREVPGDGGEKTHRPASFPNEPKAKEALPGALAAHIPNEEQNPEDRLGREESAAKRRLRVVDQKENPDDRERRDEERDPGQDQDVDPVRRGPEPEAPDRRDSRREDAVGWGALSARFLCRFRSSAKVELHLHLEGSVAPTTLVRLSGRWPRPIFPDLAAVRARRLLRGDFRSFLDFYRDVCRCLTGPGDYAAVARDLVRRLRRERIRHAEVYVSPAVVERIGLPWGPVRDAVEEVFAAHERRDGGRIVVLYDSVWQWGPEAAHRVLDQHQRCPWPRARGFGLGGDESALPARGFASVYARVRTLGLAPLVHAGEWSGPESVSSALRWLKPVRIAHGIRAAEDLALTRRLAARGVVLDVCPSSNVATGALSSIEEVARRVRALLGAGVPVTISTDDPGLFGTTLAGEFRRLSEAGLPDRELGALARFARKAALRARGPARKPRGRGGRSTPH